MNTQVNQWGNSLAVRIPGPIAKQMALVPGSDVELSLEGGRVVITPLRKRLRLAEIIASLPENPNDYDKEISAGNEVGAEITDW